MPLTPTKRGAPRTEVLLSQLASEKIQAIRGELAKVIVGQDEIVTQLLVAILANGHALIEGVPGLAKTLLVRTLAKTLGLESGRVQFTPDLMPSDIVGTMIFDPQKIEFKIRKGPIFVNILLADEINRTPPKTQAALLEAMEERKVTIDGTSYELPPPFLVFATQNPIDFEGTYPLPEAQQDRFLLKVIIEYPQPNAEKQVLRQNHQGFRAQDLDAAGVQAVLSPQELTALQAEASATTVEDKIFDYIYSLVSETRNSNDILFGASPRAGIALLQGSKALARIKGRDFVIPDDVKELAMPVLRHRVVLRPEAEVEGLRLDNVLLSLIEAQVVPR